MSHDAVAVSKFLSLVLRHQPEAIGLSLDANGWAEVEALVHLANQHGRPLTAEVIAQVVASSDKQRFAFDASGRKIRANQGHSVKVDLELSAVQPPSVLYHGTATRFLTGIRESGLLKQARHHVHLSQDEDTAVRVGERHGKVVVLVVRAAEMWQHGHLFYLSSNGVWLTDHVPASYIDFPL
jgi:putative RNA 2'-phosphotransferase